RAAISVTNEFVVESCWLIVESYGVRAFAMQSNTIPRFRKTAETLTAGAKTLPQKYFISAEVFAAEVDRILAKNWRVVGHQSRLANSGDYFVAVVAGDSLIVVRDKEDVVR